jgi:type VI secretion system protein ImpE
VLLAFAGELDRAAAQLDALLAQEPGFGASCALYRGLLQAEAERRAVHGREGRPLLPPQAPAHVEQRLAALEALRSGDADGARRALGRAEAAGPALEGKLDGEAFRSVTDDDELLGSVLEVFAAGRYLWLPFEHVRRLELTAPAQLVDLLWPSAVLEDATGREAHVHLPALYVGSAEAEDDHARVGALTQWTLQAGLCRGLGQRTLRVEGAGEAREVGLLAVRRLELWPAGAAAC